MFFMSPLNAVKLEDRWLDSITPVGSHPFAVVVPYRTQVGKATSIIIIVITVISEP